MSGGNVPRLRFPGFAGEWDSTKLSTITAIYDGTHQTPHYVENGVPFYSVEHVTSNQFTRTKFISESVFEQENKRVALEFGDILMTRIGDIGTARLIDWPVRASFYVSLALLKANPRVFVSEFLEKYIGSQLFARELHKRTIHVAFPKKINLGEIGECQLRTPTLPEQKKIAAFLGVVDAKIAALRARVLGLQTFKRGLMQALFSQTLRFTKPDGTAFPDWEEKRLAEVATRCKAKNGDLQYMRVLTNSAVQGVVDQGSYFDKDIANAENLGGYYIVKLGDFVYNPRISVTAPVGPIKRNDLGDGVMSPLYTVFRFKEVNSDFFNAYFETTFWHDYMKSIANYGARHDRMAISMGDFMDMPLPFPHPDEQTKIAEALSAMDAKIAAVQGQVDRMQDFKKGLLQQMFV